MDRTRVHAGQKVLIHAGAGGVGHICVQLAKAQGAEVFATASAAKRTFVEKLGATFIDYGSESVTEYVARCTGAIGFDLVYDTVGGKTLDASFEGVRRFGHVISCLGWG